MKYFHLFTLMGLALSGCSTLDQSIELGSGMGMAIGAGAMVAGSEAAGHSPSMESVAIGAGIGAVLGIATSYFTHKSVESDRKACEADQTEMHFGDLPPSPFIVPQKPQTKKGTH